MGNYLSSRQRGGVEELDIHASSAYRYPPKNGAYFGSHFIMGGEKFDSPQPESFLFGENSDLNFLGNKPVPFPYPPPQYTRKDGKPTIKNPTLEQQLLDYHMANEPTKTLKSLVNIRRDSLHFVKVKIPDPVSDLPPPSPPMSPQPTPPPTEAPQHKLYNIEFTFDTDVKVAITIYYFATEEVSSTGVVYTPRDPLLTSQTFSYKKGTGQIFQQPLHIFQPDLYENDLSYSPDRDVVPIVIHCVAEEGEEPRQSHMTMAVVEKHSDGQFVIKALKQKLFVDGLCYLLQEIYGIENKNAEDVVDEDLDDTGAECVVCMSDMRDTIILPCRHLCLCNSCADSLRYQANNCPICRAPFRALLQIRALQKIGHSATHPALAGEAQPEGVPPGYELVSLVEALNGPMANVPPPLTLTNDKEEAQEKPKKRNKRRGSREHRTASARAAAPTAPPPVEGGEPLPEPPGTPPQVVDKRSPSYKTANKPKDGDQDKTEVSWVNETGGTVADVKVVGSGVHDIRRQSVTIDIDTTQEDTLEMVEEELKNMSPIKRVNAIAEKTDEVEATTELLRDNRIDEDEEDSRDELFMDEDDDEDDYNDDDDAEVVSLRSQTKITSLPGTPRSGVSLRSSQESATSVNSSKQLLPDNESTTPKVIRVGKSAVAPRNESDVV